MICIAGKNDIAVNALSYLINELNIDHHDLCVIPNRTDTGDHTWQKSLKKTALDQNISVIHLEDLYKINNLIFLSLEFDRIIKPDRFISDRLYNMHFSNLPEYKGMYTSVWPILHGKSISGVTLHRIDSGIDTGDIIDQEIFPLTIQDTSRSLYQKFLDQSYFLFKKNIRNLINNQFSTTPQPSLNSTYFSKSSISFTDIQIDLARTAFQIHNQIRAFIFPEYQLPTIFGQKITKCELTERKVIQHSGSNHIIEIQGIDGFIVTCHLENNSSKEAQ